MIHELVDCKTAQEAQRYFIAAVVVATGLPPDPSSLEEVAAWWQTAQIVDDLMRGRMLMRNIEGRPSIEHLGELEE